MNIQKLWGQIRSGVVVEDSRSAPVQRVVFSDKEILRTSLSKPVYKRADISRVAITVKCLLEILVKFTITSGKKHGQKY